MFLEMPLPFFVHDMINLVYYEPSTEINKYFYAYYISILKVL